MRTHRIVLASDEFWIYDYDLPSRTDEGPYHNQWEVVVYNKIRAVDEAGNRSEPVIPIYIGDQVCAE